jgi:polyhydroxyalkanoate synthase
MWRISALSSRTCCSASPSCCRTSDDRRFADPAWSQNPLYKRYLQTYLAWRKELHNWIDESNLAAKDVARGHFVINLMTEAMAPTNTAANPAAVKRFFETGGKSLLDGLSHLAKDMVHNGGMPSQVNMGAFEVGKTLGVTEGAVVFRNDVLELIQYKPITEQVHERPLLVVPPQINKFYVFDLSPEKSLARFCLRSNVQTFIVSWRNPTKEQREWGLSTYIEALKEAIDVVTAITGSKDVNMLGACSGGITCTALLGHYAAIGENKVNSLTLMVSVLDTTLDSDVALFVNEQTLESAKRHSYQAGVLEGRDMAKVFAWMRPNDLIWNYWVNNYLLGNEPPVFDILFWNNDTTRLPAAFHGDLIELFKNNPLIRPNALEVCGTAHRPQAGDCRRFLPGRHHRPYHSVEVLLQVRSAIRWQRRIRAVQQRAHPEHPEPARQSEIPLHDQYGNGGQCR